MTGKNYNNTQKGQVLLITVMLLATVITVVMTVAFNTTTETQISILEQESQRALSAAEAGLEAALKNSPGTAVSLGSLVGLESGITGTAEVLNTTSQTFVSPLLQKDETYTFYLSDFSTANGVNSFTNYFSGNVTLYFQGSCADDGQGVVLEIVRVKDDNSITRYLTDPCSYMASSSLAASANAVPVGGVSFGYKTSAVPITGDTRLFMVRALFNSTQLALQGSSNLPLQGKTVVSEARTAGGVAKRIQLFQSYPQIPTDFFVTGF